MAPAGVRRRRRGCRCRGGRCRARWRSGGRWRRRRRCAPAGRGRARRLRAASVTERRGVTQRWEAERDKTTRGVACYSAIQRSTVYTAITRTWTHNMLHQDHHDSNTQCLTPRLPGLLRTMLHTAITRT